jgi:hypothetical protein
MAYVGSGYVGFSQKKREGRSSDWTAGRSSRPKSSGDASRGQTKGQWDVEVAKLDFRERAEIS